MVLGWAPTGSRFKVQRSRTATLFLMLGGASPVERARSTRKRRRAPHSKEAAPRKEGTFSCAKRFGSAVLRTAFRGGGAGSGGNGLVSIRCAVPCPHGQAYVGIPVLTDRPTWGSLSLPTGLRGDPRPHGQAYVGVPVLTDRPTSGSLSLPTGLRDGFALSLPTGLLEALYSRPGHLTVPRLEYGI